MVPENDLVGAGGGHGGFFYFETRFGGGDPGGGVRSGHSGRLVVIVALEFEMMLWLSLVVLVKFKVKSLKARE